MQWLEYIQPGKPQQNTYVEQFNRAALGAALSISLG
ncbi:MAG: integrase core domain-containing protein [Pigmentiphaga sp.]